MVKYHATPKSPCCVNSYAVPVFFFYLDIIIRPNYLTLLDVLEFEFKKVICIDLLLRNLICYI